MLLLAADEHVCTTTTRTVKALAATLTRERGRLLIQAAIVAGLLPLPAQRTSINFGGFLEDARMERLSVWCHADPATRAVPRCDWVRQKPNRYVSKAPRLPALASTARVTFGMHPDYGTWFVEVESAAGFCRCDEGASA